MPDSQQPTVTPTPEAAQHVPAVPVCPAHKRLEDKVDAVLVQVSNHLPTQLRQQEQRTKGAIAFVVVLGAVVLAIGEAAGAWKIGTAGLSVVGTAGVITTAYWGIARRSGGNGSSNGG